MQCHFSHECVLCQQPSTAHRAVTGIAQARTHVHSGHAPIVGVTHIPSRSIHERGSRITSFPASEPYLHRVHQCSNGRVIITVMWRHEHTKQHAAHLGGIFLCSKAYTIITRVSRCPQLHSLTSSPPMKKGYSLGNIASRVPHNVFMNVNRLGLARSTKHLQERTAAAVSNIHALTGALIHTLTRRRFTTSEPLPKPPPQLVLAEMGCCCCRTPGNQCRGMP